MGPDCKLSVVEIDSITQAWTQVSNEGIQSQ